MPKTSLNRIEMTHMKSSTTARKNLSTYVTGILLTAALSFGFADESSATTVTFTGSDKDYSGQSGDTYSNLTINSILVNNVGYKDCIDCTLTFTGQNDGKLKIFGAITAGAGSNDLFTGKLSHFNKEPDPDGTVTRLTASVSGQFKGDLSQQLFGTSTVDSSEGAVSTFEFNITFDTDTFNYVSSSVSAYTNKAAVPIPAALPLFGSALMGLTFIGFRRRS